MREYDDLPYIVIERRSGGAGPFLWGLLLGAGAALLLAPRSGEETQEEIRQRARRLREAAEDRVNSARSAVTRTRDRLQDQLDSVRETVASQAERAREAIETGRRVARDARGELERRVAEAKESYSAAADAVLDARQAPAPPQADVVVTDVIVEEAEDRPDLG